MDIKHNGGEYSQIVYIHQSPSLVCEALCQELALYQPL
jgi:hypothetical protein